MIAFLLQHKDEILGALLAISEGLAVIAVLIDPSGKAGGIVASVIKALVSVGAKNPELPK